LKERNLRWFSEVVTLILLNTVPAGIELKEIPTWPKALRTFHFETWIEYDSFSYPLVDGQARRIFPPRAFIEALDSQKATLEEIYIGGTNDDLGIDGTVVGSLHAFENLKRLGLPREFMFLEVLEPRMHGKTYEDLPRLFEILPSSLEELQIEAGLEFRWHEVEDGTSGPILAALELFIQFVDVMRFRHLCPN
jgi:hypothetical protein